jgi:hypothetical protein
MFKKVQLEDQKKEMNIIRAMRGVLPVGGMLELRQQEFNIVW